MAKIDTQEKANIYRMGVISGRVEMIMLAMVFGLLGWTIWIFLS